MAAQLSLLEAAFADNAASSAAEDRVSHATLAAVEKAVGKSPGLFKQARASVAKMCNAPGTDAAWIRTVFSGDYPLLAGLTFEATPRTQALRPRRELIVATMVARLERDRDSRYLAAPSAVVLALSGFLKQGDLMVSDFKPSFVSLVSRLGAALMLPPPPNSEWAAHVSLCRLSSLLLLQSPDGLGTLCMAMGQADLLNSVEGGLPGFEVYRICLRLASGSPEPFSSVSGSPSHVKSLGEVDAWSALSVFALDLIAQRPNFGPANVAIALDLVAQSFSNSAKIRQSQQSSQRREADLSDLVSAFATLDSIVAVSPQLVPSVERVIMPPHREYLVEFNEVRDVVAPLHRRLGIAHLHRLAQSVYARGLGLPSLDLDAGDVTERSMIFDLELLQNAQLPLPKCLELASVCCKPLFCPALARTFSSCFPQAVQGLSSLPEALQPPAVPPMDKLIPLFAADSSRAPCFVQACLSSANRPQDLYYEALVEASESVFPSNELSLKPPPHLSAALDWTALWGARALVATTLKSHLGLAHATFSHIEERLNNGDDSLVNLVWHLQREMYAFPLVLKEPRVVTFFAKNHATCNAWLQKLMGLCMNVEAERTLGTGLLPVWSLFHSVESGNIGADTSLDAACTAMNVLIARRDGAACEILGDWTSATFSDIAGVDLFAQGCVAHADGAYLAAAAQLRQAAVVCVEAGLPQCEPLLRLSVNGALECLAQCGEFAEAQSFVAKLADLQMRVWSVFQARDADRMGDALVPLVFSQAILAALDPGTTSAPTSEESMTNKSMLYRNRFGVVGCLADLAQHQNPASLELMKSVRDKASKATGLIRCSLDSLLVGGSALVSKNIYLPMSTSEESDFYWAFMHVVRTRLGFPPDVNSIIREAHRSVHVGGDPRTALAMLRLVENPPSNTRQSRNALALAQLLAAKDAGPPAWLVADAGLLAPLANGVPQRISASSPEAFMAWALRAWSLGQHQVALECLEQHLRQAQPPSSAACVLYVSCLDELSWQRYGEDLPLEALRLMLPHLVARGKTDERVAKPLMRLIDAKDSNVVWALVGEEQVPKTQLVPVLDHARKTQSQVLEQTRILACALVGAARTWDEDWDALLEDPYLSPGSEVLASAIAELFGRTLAVQPRSQFNDAFAQSSAGAAISEVHDDPTNALLVAKAKAAVHQFVNSQGSKRSLRAMVVRPDLLSLDAVSIPGKRSGGDSAAVRIASVSDSVYVLKTKTRPRKICFLDSTGQTRNFLLKSAEDLHLDQRVVGIWDVVNPRLTWPMRLYHVQPLSRSVGLIQWVERSVPLYHYYRTWRGGGGGAAATGPVLDGDDLAETELFKKALREAGGDRLAAFRQMRSLVDETLLAKALWASSVNVEAWWSRATNFATSCGVGSGLGWALGLGDRHLDNILMDVDSGQLVHIDLNVCFDKGLTLRVPETVPFRLTGVMVKALPLLGQAPDQGHFARATADTIDMLRVAMPEVLACLDAFVHDPIVGRSEATKRLRAKLDLEASLSAFFKDAREWLGDEIVLQMRREPDLKSFAGESEFELRTALERARLHAQRALNECARQRDHVAAALALVSGGRCAAVAAASSTPARIELAETLPSFSSVGSASSGASKASVFTAQQKEQIKALESAVEAAEQLAVEAAKGPLASLCALIREAHPTLASLGLQWGTHIEQALNGGNSKPNTNKVSPSRLSPESCASLLQYTERFREVGASVIEMARTFEDSWKRLPSPQTPAQLQATSRMERALKRVKECAALCDACVLLVSVAARPLLPVEMQAVEAFADAQRRFNAFVQAPALVRACRRAPRPALESGDAITGLGSAELQRYLDLCESLEPGPQVDEACAALERAMVDLERLKKARLIELSLEGVGGNNGAAVKQAKAAKQRVKERLDTTARNSRLLVRALVAEATNESNLANMYEGWCAWI